MAILPRLRMFAASQGFPRGRESAATQAPAVSAYPSLARSNDADSPTLSKFRRAAVNCRPHS